MLTAELDQESRFRLPILKVFKKLVAKYTINVQLKELNGYPQRNMQVEDLSCRYDYTYLNKFLGILFPKR